MFIKKISQWQKTEEYRGGPFPIIEYRYGKGSCVIRCAFRTYDGGISYRKDGWDVICTFRNGEIAIHRVAWFRRLKDAQFWVELGASN